MNEFVANQVERVAVFTLYGETKLLVVGQEYIEVRVSAHTSGGLWRLGDGRDRWLWRRCDRGARN